VSYYSAIPIAIGLAAGIAMVMLFAIGINLKEGTTASQSQNGSFLPAPDIIGQVKLDNKVQHIYTTMTVLNGTVDSVDGISLEVVNKTDIADTIVGPHAVLPNSSAITYLRWPSGDPKHYDRTFVSDSDLAELTLKHGTTPDGQTIVAATITNTGTSNFKVAEFWARGDKSSPQTPQGYGYNPVEAYAVEDGFNSTMWINPPIVALSHSVTVMPDQSLSFYIKGIWTANVTNVTYMPVNLFDFAAHFFQDKPAMDTRGGGSWHIGINSVYLPRPQ
jgi:hypothetical protein